MSKVAKHFKKILILALVISVTVVWYAVLYFENHRNSSITFFDIGQGDSIFIQAKNGNQVLIDGGPDSRVLAKLGQVMPFWDKSIDLLILTHPHADHLDGLLEVLKRYDVDKVLETGVNHSIPEYEEWGRLLKEKNVKVVIAKSGQRVLFSSSEYLDILSPLESFDRASPKNIHEAVIVSKLVFASTTALFMGDAEKSLEYRLLFSGLDLSADILKVGHHGSKTSTSEDFLRAVTPRLAIISAGKKNRYGHPYQEVLDRLRQSGVKIFRTDEEGDIVIASDGSEFKITATK